MSKAVKKVFSGVKKVVKKVTGFVKKYWKEIVLAAAVVFTAGAALGYVGMSASGGLAFGSANVSAAAAAGVSQGIGAAWSALGNSALGLIGVEGAGTGVFGQGYLGANSAAAQAAAAAQTAATGVAGSGLTPQAFYSAQAGAQLPGAAAGAGMQGGVAGATVTGAGNAAAVGNAAAAGNVAAAGNAVTAGNALAGGTVPVTGAPTTGGGLLSNAAANPAVNSVTNSAAKTGLKGWASKQSAGDWAQLGGLGLSVAGALTDDEEEVPDYAIAGDHSYETARAIDVVRARAEQGDPDAINQLAAAGDAQAARVAARQQQGLMQAPVRYRATDKDEQAQHRYKRYV